MRLAILAFVAGIGWLQQQALLPNLWWAALLLLTPLLILVRPVLLKRGIGILAAFMAGYFWAAGVAQHRLADALPEAWEGRDIQVIGVVAELPQFTERGVRFTFDIEEVITPHAKIPAHIQLYWFARSNDADQDAHLNPARLHAGERWQLVVRLKRPHGTANLHGFDYEAWLLEQNIRATGYIRKDPNNFRLNQFVPRPAYAVERLRDVIALRLKRVMQDEPYAGVLTALAIGDQHTIPQNQWRVFFRTGVNHLMSISGLHVTLFSSFVFTLVYWLWRQSAWLTQRLPARKAALLFGVAAAFAYALLTGFAVPAQRTFYMLIIVAAAVWFDRLSSASRVLILALGVVALLDPWAVLAPGFWLSFGAVALIFYITSQRIGAFNLWIQALRVQGAVTLGLVPAMLLLFQQVSLVSPFANAVAIPVVSYLIVPLTLLGALLPLDFPLHAAHSLMGWLMQALQWFAQAPDAMWQQHAPPGWTIVVAVIGVAWLLAPRGFPARLVGACLLLPMFMLAPLPVPPGVLQLTVLDVGQGLALVLRTAGHALVYDTGSRFSNDLDAGARTVLPHLRATGVSKLDGLIISHDDNDHSGGAVSVLDGLPVQWLLSSLPAEHPAQNRGVRSIRCEAGQRWQWDNVQFEILYPGSDTYSERRKDNDRGCVLRVTVGEHTLLLPADIEAKSERALLASAADKLRADVLVVPHHGSRTSSTAEFVAAVNPQIAIFTVGYRNRFGHPKPEVLARYGALTTQVFRSDMDGEIELKLPETGPIEIQSYRKQNPRYWRGS